MESLDTTILNTGVPTIAKALEVAPLSMKSALTSYTLSLAVFIPVSGWIADRFGTRRVFFTAIGVFTLGSFLCGLTQNLPMLVASRIIQGCGGALMLPIGRIALVRTFPKSELLRAMSFVAIPGLIGPLVGPLAGGLIVAYSHWRMIFFVNLPIGVLGFYFAFRHMPDFRADRRDPLDVIGLVLFGSGIALLSYVLEIFGEHSMDLKTEIFLVVISLVLLGAYGVHAANTRYPLLRLNLFRIRTFRVAVMGSFFTRLGIGGMPFLLPLLYQIGLGYSPVESGLLIMPQPIAAMVLRLLMGRILRQLGYRQVLFWNTVASGVVIALFATVGPHEFRGVTHPTSVGLIVLLAFCFGVVSSLQYSSMATLQFADIGEEEASMASSIASTVQQMSMSFGVAIASLVTLYFVGGERRPGDVHLIEGIHRSFAAMGVYTAIAAIGFLRLKANDGASVSLQGRAEH